MYILTFIIVLLFILLVWLHTEYSLFRPPVKGLPVLMYHKISESSPDGLTVTVQQFENQLRYLKKKGYTALDFVSLARLHRDRLPLPSGAIILTFDDAYENFSSLALPLLEKYGFRASVFVPVAFIGKCNAWDFGNDPLMEAGKLKELALNRTTEIGLHSYLHQSYRDLTPVQIGEDLKQCTETLDSSGIPFARVLAYPYGAYPRKEQERKEAMFAVFRRHRLDFALRIGNRINAWPLREPYEIQRIDIRGTDPGFVFGIKVRKGRAKLFS